MPRERERRDVPRERRAVRYIEREGEIEGKRKGGGGGGRKESENRHVPVRRSLMTVVSAEASTEAEAYADWKLLLENSRH